MIRHEKPLLIQPYDEDPQDHLTFDDLGQVVSISERGTITKDVLKLNRDRLLEERRSSASQFDKTRQDYLNQLISFQTFYETIKPMLASSHLFAGMHRALLAKAERDWNAEEPHSAT